MDGLDMLGIDREKLKKNAPYIGGGVGAFIGVLVAAFTGKHTRGWFGRANFFGRSAPRLVRVGFGVATGAAVGAGAAYGIKKAVEHSGSLPALPAGTKPLRPKK